MVRLLILQGWRREKRDGPEGPGRTQTMFTFFHIAQNDRRRRILLLTLLTFAALC